MAAPMDPAKLPEAELERIFREHHAMVFRAAYRITGNADDAEDVLQTVFLRMIKRDPGGRTGRQHGQFPTPSRGQRGARPGAIRARTFGRYPLDELEPVLAEPAHRGPTAMQNSGEIREWLRGALARLNPRIARNVHAAVLRRQR